MPKEYFVIVNKEIIPKQMRTSKYADLMVRAKKLSQTEALKITETEDTNLLAIMSLMRKQGYVVALRTENKIKNLYISKAEPQTKKTK